MPGKNWLFTRDSEGTTPPPPPERPMASSSEGTGVGAVDFTY
jgi:hypothetical protein